MEDKDRSPQDRAKNKYILFAFLGFFGVVFIVDAFFIHMALKTQTGVVSERTYEKGLNFNQTLSEAKAQPSLNDRVTFKNNILRWNLNDKAINNADVNARIIRPIQAGHDFDIKLVNQGDGIYEARLDLPFKGLWEAKLKSKWDNKQGWQTYKTTHQFIVK